MKNLLTLLLLTLTVLSSCKKDEDDYIIKKESFDEPGLWYNDNNEEYSCIVNKGKLEMTVNVPDFCAYWLDLYTEITYDYSVSADCSLILEDKTMDGILGIEYNHFDKVFYSVFIITKNGVFSVVKYEGAKQTTLLSSAIDKSILGPSGEINHLEVLQRSSSTEFKVNHITVGTISYGRTYPKVKAGLLINSFEEPYFTKTKAEYDNFTIRKL